MRVLSWNLYHGRDFPPDPTLFTLRARLLRRTERNDTHVQVNRPLLEEFARVLDGLEWDVALLQEAPPRWFGELQRRIGAAGARTLTSRNLLPPVQGALADFNPDLMASWEGGSNQILVRASGRIAEHRELTLTRRPERRRMHFARLELPGAGPLCVANLHATAGRPARAAAEMLAAAEAAVAWSGNVPLVFGGDLNLRPASDPEPFARLDERFGLREPTAPDAIDHVLARGLDVAEPPRRRG
ncbi:MAG TPA: endonuclease/exonuclease/phosphatase family protein, partial [Thermoleophilaceae bacterium]|nr:endonuclease/exonuclease/phosphatase family protein [Thermoleophilaceae bacterium]